MRILEILMISQVISMRRLGLPFTTITAMATTMLMNSGMTTPSINTMIRSIMNSITTSTTMSMSIGPGTSSMDMTNCIQVNMKTSGNRPNSHSPPPASLLAIFREQKLRLEKSRFPNITDGVLRRSLWSQSMSRLPHHRWNPAGTLKG
jgi:hypothetical protein